MKLVAKTYELLMKIEEFVRVNEDMAEVGDSGEKTRGWTGRSWRGSLPCRSGKRGLGFLSFENKIDNAF